MASTAAASITATPCPARRRAPRPRLRGRPRRSPRDHPRSAARRSVLYTAAMALRTDPRTRDDEPRGTSPDRSVRDAAFEALRRRGLTTLFANPGSTEVPFL